MDLVKRRGQTHRKVARHEVKVSYLPKQKRIYEAGDKASKLTAWMVARERASMHIGELCLESGEIVRERGQITETFVTHMATFNTLTAEPPQTELESFVRDCLVKTLHREQQEAIDLDLTAAEITVTLAQMQAGKATGPSGQPVEFFCKQTRRVSKPMLFMYKDALPMRSPPADLCMVTIVLLHNAGKPE
ncbi:hypothetical protein NDU88_001474 [Pleurodeles waltl]|uniref:Uncharacterized protein n=1 Tax=Pleurodeles waltl TaxID=8319 RepID=A0AAV7U817_PLEWA|nr:hypothetical protein NDU88_001474 [Pleurodeles waltl]